MPAWADLYMVGEEVLSKIFLNEKTPGNHVGIVVTKFLAFVQPYDPRPEPCICIYTPSGAATFPMELLPLVRKALEEAEK